MSGVLTLLEENQGKWRPIAHFRLKSRYRLPDFADSMALVSDEGLDQLIWFDPTTDKGSIVSLQHIRTWAVLGKQGFIAASTNHVVVHIDSVQAEWPEELVSTVALRVNSPEDILVGIGRQDGTVRLVKLSRMGTKMQRTDIWTRQLHTGPVTSIAFLGTDRIVTGGTDRALCMIATGPAEEGDRSKMVRFALTLRCRGIRVDRMRGERERNLLRQLASQQ